MLRPVQHTLEEHRMLAHGDHVLVAVSGGGDSVALADLLSQLAPALEISLCLVCVDHGLRAESPGEVEQVRVLAAHLGHPFESLSLTGLEGSNLQARARAARYVALERLAGQLSANRIATGHTRDDQAETVLARVIGGGGLRGLAGIRPRRTLRGVDGHFDDCVDEHGVDEHDGHGVDGHGVGHGVDGALDRNCSVIRPLIDCRRDDLREYLRRRKLSWIEDPSNASNRFERVRIRQLLTTLASENPQVVGHLADLAEDARGADRVLRACAQRWLVRAADGKALRLKVLQAASSPVRAVVLRTWVETGTQRVPRRSQVHALLHLVQTGHGEVLLGDDWGAHVERGCLVLDRKKRRTRSSKELRSRPPDD